MTGVQTCALPISIFEYFDCLLVGLTATPKDEIDHNTYRLFDLEDVVPTDAYPLDQAVADGHLVPPLAVSVPLKFQRDGIQYAQLTEAEKEQWDALEWTESLRVFQSCPLTTPKRTRSSLQMLAIARAMSALCA